MSEDDTFRRLKRRPFEEMDAEYRDRFWEFYKDRNLYESWLKDTGWTHEELTKEGDARTKNRG